MNKKILLLCTIGKKLLSSCILTLTLTTTVLAAYSPPKKPSRPNGPVSSNSTRTNGCSATTKANLTALAPMGHVGQTVSQQPTFTWFVPDTKSFPMEFSLYEYSTSGRGKKIKSFQFPSQRGIMQFSLSQDKLNLSVGKKYLWQIALLCDPNNPGKDLYTEAVIEIVPMATNLANQIAQTTSSTQKARIYAEASFWYDAFAEALKSQDKAFKITLLEDIRDSEVLEAKADKISNKIKDQLDNQASQLQKIIEIEQKR